MTLLIKNVRILSNDGENQEPGCVFVSDGKISAIGNFPNKNADTVIDGQGAWLCPGFIDPDTDSDHYLTLFDHPSQEDFLRQGVTTIMGGMCGSSLAPLLYGSLESFRKWGNIDRVNVNWHTMEELLQILGSRRLGVNFGTLVGHSTVRRAIVGESLRDLTKNELGVLGATLQESLNAGAFGMSVGLGYVHSKRTPYSELRSLAEIVARANGVFAVHLRSSGKGIVPSVEEVIKLARDTGVKILISHLTPLLGAESEYEEALGLIEALPASTDLNFDIYPSPYSLVALYTFLPDWAQNGGVDVMLANVKDDWLRERMKKEMPRLDPNEVMIAQAPGNDFLVGKSLGAIQEMYELPDERDALLKLMVTMNMQGGVLHKDLNYDLILKALASPRSFVASNAPSFDLHDKTRRVKSERTTRTFTTFLSLVAEKSMMPFKDAIEKITTRPAEKFGLSGRGVLKEGNVADLVCVKDAEIRFTVVNGKVAMQNAEWTGAASGVALRHVAPKGR